MNYGKKGVRRKQRALHAKSEKWGKKFALTFFNVMLAGIVAVGILGASVGFGVFRGIIDTAPYSPPDFPLLSTTSTATRRQN